jgi:DNA-binding transcriptional LysR family regulator
VTPTEAGQAYLDRIRPLLDEYENLDLAVKNISQTPRGRLRLTAASARWNSRRASRPSQVRIRRSRSTSPAPTGW